MSLRMPMAHVLTLGVCATGYAHVYSPTYVRYAHVYSPTYVRYAHVYQPIRTDD